MILKIRKCGRELVLIDLRSFPMQCYVRRPFLASNSDHPSSRKALPRTYILGRSTYQLTRSFHQLMIASQSEPSSFVRVPSILDICLGSPHHNQAFSQTGGFGVLMAQGTWLCPRNLDSAANQASRLSIGVRQACSLSGEARRVLPSAGRCRR
jgi:hypothetical protein